MSRQGINLDRSTLADWVDRKSFELSPAFDALIADVKRFTKLFMDETWAPVLDPDSSKIGTEYFWALARSDWPWNDGAPLLTETRMPAGYNTASQGLYRHSRSPRRQVAIPAASFASLKTRHRHTSVVRRIECFHHRPTTATNPPPVAHQGSASEQSLLYRQAVEAPHVLVGVDATKMDRFRIERVHARSLPSFRGTVQ